MEIFLILKGGGTYIEGEGESLKCDNFLIYVYVDTPHRGNLTLIWIFKKIDFTLC